MTKAKPSSTPMVSHPPLSTYDGTDLDDSSLYQSVIGSLQYCNGTLMGTMDHGVLFNPSNSLQLTAFSNANWASCPDNHQYTSGYCLFRCQSSVLISQKVAHCFTIQYRG